MAPILLLVVTYQSVSSDLCRTVSAISMPIMGQNHPVSVFTTLKMESKVSDKVEYLRAA